MNRLIVISALALTASTAAFAQERAVPPPPGASGTVVTGQPNTTGNSRDVIIAPGATGAETATTNSAAGGNAGQPSRAVPQGSAGSSGGTSGGQ
ncbi:hypothetical protein [Methylobacterium oxalidis]|uniref:Uncharacterized protein n=1 Tax=Methylobacterium oxalidis TaxID=944322 RepID=A0A512J3D2_9HYPH|nr:hypothetical protein [Methylobacterium oxalidis]GEP04423.1 hypothetical protein MOX02_24610 [Methylobacterium oxalidis]GJE35226.1 hypothetical protein LDDCCGHA_5444 [Methylobacterium oxalidis]GLS62795.1 hypothetical protein GCM10007888_11760 [Methylobacterium oxalidis]